MWEAYSVAVRVGLNNQVTSGLIGMSTAFMRVNHDARALQGELNKIKLMGVTGAVVGGAGFMGLNLISKTLPDAKEYAHQLAQMNIAGMKQAEIARSINAAWALNRTVPTSTAAQNLEAVRELRTVFGSTDEAIKWLPTAQKLAYILENTAGGAGTSKTRAKEVQALARALDLRNATTNPAETTLQADLMTKAIVGSGGVLSARDFNSAFKYGRTATLGWSNDFAYKILPSLMQELKTGSGAGAGGGPGNPLMSAYSAVVQGAVPQKALGVWNQLGLLDPSKVVWTKAGEAKGLRPGAISRSDLFIENPYLWTQTVLRPALIRAGHDTEKEQRQVMGYLFPNRTAGAVMSTMLFQSRAIERDRRMFGIASGLGSYEQLMKTDPKAADAALMAQWKNLLTVIGYEILPYVVRGTLALADGLRDLAEWSRRNPNMVKALVLGFAALSGAMAFGGSVMLMATAWKGLSLAFGMLSASKVVATAKGMAALGNAALLFPTTGQLLWQFATTAMAVASTIAGAAALIGGIVTPFAAAGASVANGARYQRILKDPSRASAADRAWALDYANRNAANYGAQVANKQINAADGRRRQAKWGADALALSGASPFVGGGGAAATPTGKLGNVYMDSNKVGEVLADRIAGRLGYQNAGARPDGQASLAWPGVPYK